LGESKRECLRVDFDRRLRLEFHGSKVTTDAGFLAYRELDDALELTEMTGDVCCDNRTGKNAWHGMMGQFRQSLFDRLGGYDDVNDADRLGRDPAMRWIVGGKAIERHAASTSQLGRFETELLASDSNLAALTALLGAWIDRVSFRKFRDNAVRLQLHALAYNLANFMRTLALPKEVEHWSLTTLREKLVKIGAKAVSHGTLRVVAVHPVPQRLTVHARGRAADAREAPSSTSASASRRRAWSLSFVPRAAARNPSADNSVRVMAIAISILLSESVA